jgi:hypothetical protein
MRPNIIPSILFLSMGQFSLVGESTFFQLCVRLAQDPITLSVFVIIFIVYGWGPAQIYSANLYVYKLSLFFKKIFIKGIWCKT